MYPVDSGKGRAVVVITYLAKERPKASQAPEDLLYMDIQVGPREEAKLRLGAYTVDPEFGQIGRCIIPHEVEIEFEYNSSWTTRMDCLKAGLIQVHFHFRGWKELLAAYVPKDKLPQLKEIFHCYGSVIFNFREFSLPKSPLLMNLEGRDRSAVAKPVPNGATSFSFSGKIPTSSSRCHTP